MRFEIALLSASLGLLASDCSALKVGLISDLHLHLRYDPFWGPVPDDEGDCIVNGGTKTDVKAPMGRYGCDSPPTLLNAMLDEFNRSHGKQDVIIITGDLSAHHTALPYGDETAEDTYPLLLATHSGITELMTAKFPDTLIVPAFGNNDSEYHDNPIPKDDAFFFYDYIFNLWFRTLPPNVLQLSTVEKEAIYDTFINGGYYRIDLTDSVSILAMNTLYYDSERS